ncbi:MAG: glycosyltransferase family 4 protein [Burkholderiaceae bacterium]
MKILYHHRTRSKDGQYVHIEEMVGALQALGHEVVMVAPAGAENEAFGADAGWIAKLKQYLPKFAYELAELSYSAVAYMKLADAVRRHRPDCLYERYNLFLPAGILVSRRFSLPMLLEVNAPLFEERARYDGLSLKRIARWTEQYTWCNADRVLPVTQVLANMVVANGVDRHRIVVIPNGINVSRFDDAPGTEQAKQALGLGPGLVLGFTGFVRDWHGLDKVISMIAHDAPNADRTLLIVGDGPARAALEQQAKTLGISARVRFTGIVGRDEVARYIAAFDIALQPAVVAYASPLKLFEYLALGKAIIGPAQPNLQEILTDGQNAVLFDPDDPEAMSQAIGRLCADPLLRRRIADNARRTITDQRLTWLENAQRVVDLFVQLQKAKCHSRECDSD